ncbi:hypothetical protein [Methanosphaerula palustris]|uniref:hypothetical protein n=1 Tax=Methanosphaerula palustris TaxID=475088 RepID=UPI0001848E86|nr:hypothetical protein [Methanosphaerula palustris]
MAVISGNNRTACALHPRPLDDGVDAALQHEAEAGVVGAFTNEDSLLRLAGAILMDINEEWVTGRKYSTMEER